VRIARIYSFSNTTSLYWIKHVSIIALFPFLLQLLFHDNSCSSGR